MIETHDLTKEFPLEAGESFTAVDGVKFKVATGEVLALLGPNGAGKTTTVRLLAAILRPTRGWAKVAGFDVVRNPVAVRRRIGMLTEVPGLYERMRAREYLDFFGRLYGLSDVEQARRVAYLTEKLGVAHVLGARIDTFSKGMQQKLAIVRAMLHAPLVLLLDEPTSALDPQSARVVRDSLADLRNDRRAIVICTHNLSEAEALADRIAIINRGRIIIHGTPEELKTRLLGAPLMELRLADAVDGLEPSLRQMLEIETIGRDRIRFRTDTPQDTNPRLLRWLAEQGRDVVTLSEVPQSLEDVYLRVVAQGKEDISSE
jgi:ABC-2 type transport system ATP-binding protein